PTKAGNSDSRRGFSTEILEDKPILLAENNQFSAAKRAIDLRKVEGTMTHLVLQYHAEVLEGPCALCSQPVVLEPGLQLCQDDPKCPVCRNCARRAAPALAALQGLAGTAERVGRINSHMVTPPLTALLELARAAESFTASAPI